MTFNPNPLSAMYRVIVPRTVFVPEQVRGTFDLYNVKLSELLDLSQALEILGITGVAMFVYVNNIYNHASDIFLKDDLIHEFDKFDLMDKYRDDLNKYPELREPYNNIVKHIDGYTISPPHLSNGYIKSPEDTIDGKVQYYVPVMESIGDRIYGIRLKAVTGGVYTKQEGYKHAIVANIGVLSKSYEIRQIACMEYYKTFIRRC